MNAVDRYVGQYCKYMEDGIMQTGEGYALNEQYKTLTPSEKDAANAKINSIRKESDQKIKEYVDLFQSYMENDGTIDAGEERSLNSKYEKLNSGQQISANEGVNSFIEQSNKKIDAYVNLFRKVKADNRIEEKEQKSIDAQYKELNAGEREAALKKINSRIDSYMNLFHKYWQNDGYIDNLEYLELDQIRCGMDQWENDAVDAEIFAWNEEDSFHKNPIYWDTKAYVGNNHISNDQNKSDISYDQINGDAFVQGVGDPHAVHPSDVDQEELGDCYLMSSLAAIANQRPDLIEKMIETDITGHTYTITFYKNQNPVEIKVDARFPCDSTNNDPIFAQTGDSDYVNGQSEYELWPMLIEKAYAKMEGSYGSINGGNGGAAMELLTGSKSEKISLPTLTINKLASYYNNGYAVYAGTHDEQLLPFDLPWDTPKPLLDNGTLSYDHGYYITDVNVKDDTVTLRNPWGWNKGEIKLTFDEFQKHFQSMYVNSLGGRIIHEEDSILA